MKKCSYCGKEYSEEIVSCPIDGEALIEIIPSNPPDQTAPKTANPCIETIPWYRKDSTAWTAAVMGFFCCAPCAMDCWNPVFDRRYLLQHSP